MRILDQSKTKLALACTVALGALTNTPAIAQTSSSSLVLEEVIVTAQRKEQSANDVGMDIQTYSGESLEMLRVDSVADLTAVIPSLTVAQSYQGVPTYTLRGIGFNTINISAKSTVGIYVDEVAQPYPLMASGPSFDLQRAEVLKGPQGTLFGRNTTAGLINLVTNKPTEEFEGMVRAEVGNFSTGNIEAMVSGPLSDTFGARLAVRSENRGDGWQKSNTRDEELGEVDRQAARLSLAWTPSDDLRVDFSYNFWSDKSDMLAAQAIGFTPSTTGSPFNASGLVDYVAANMPTEADQADWAPLSTRGVDVGTGLGMPGDLAQDSEFHGLKLSIDYHLANDMRLVSLTGYQDIERGGITDFSGAPYELLVQDLDGAIESFSQEIRLEGSTDKANWMVGAYYAEDDVLDSNRTMLGENANANLIRFFTTTLLETPFNSGGYGLLDALQAFRTYEDYAEMDVKSWSVFGNVDWELSERLSLTTGIRYTEDTQDYAGCSRDFNGNMLPNVNITNRALYFQAYGVFTAPIGMGECNTFDPATGTFGIVESELDEDNVSWRLALNYMLNDDTLLYASATQGSKAGETPVNPANIAFQNAPVTQEQLLAYELGVKATLMGGRLQANAAGFYYQYDDKQLNVYFADPIYTALPRLDNIEDSVAYGIETELTFRATENLTAIAALTLLNTEVQDYVGINPAGQEVNYDGAEFNYSPDTTGTITLVYDKELTDELGLNGTLNARYQSESYANLEASEEFTIDSYSVLNASLGIYSLNGVWDVSIWGQNLTDEYYWTTVTQGANTVIRFPGMTRTYGASLTYRF